MGSINNNIVGLVAAALFCALSPMHSAQADCRYLDSNNQLRSVASIEDVPREKRRFATCFDQQLLAAPDEMELEGNIRKEVLSTSIGRIELRWPRSAESVLKSTPRRTVAKAAGLVARAVRSGAFPQEMKSSDTEWKVVLIDEIAPELPIPSFLALNCHPGWMLPPADVYLVAQRLSSSCSKDFQRSETEADTQFLSVLVHEFGHVLEHNFFGEIYPRERMRSEGFATWFERYVLDKTGADTPGLKEYFSKRLEYSLKQKPQFYFQGTGLDYARAASYFKAVQERFQLRGVFRILKRVREDHVSMVEAINREFGWSPKQLEAAVKEL